MSKIIVAGHICLDITPVCNERKSDKIEDILRPGKLINSDKCDVHTGGVVANTGLAIKKLGGESILAGKIGDDEFGKIILDVMNEYNAADNMIVAKGESTSYSVVLVFPGIDRIFIHNPGANDTFQSTDLSDELIEQGSHFHFGYPPLMKKMYTGSGAHLAVILKRVKKAGLTTSLDLAAVDPDSSAGEANWKRILTNVLPYVDFFVPSFEELCYMLDPRKLEMRVAQAEKDNVDVTMIINIEDDVKPLAKQCLELGAKVVVIKCGAQGMYYMTSDKPDMMVMCEEKGLKIEEWCGKKGYVRSFEPDEMVSGTGAGDTSIAAFLLSMERHKSVFECVQLAAGCGAMCVTGIDALSGLIPLEDIQKKIDSGWKKRSNSLESGKEETK